MSVADSFNRVSQQTSAFWNARNARERTMLSVAIGVVLLGLIYALLIDPAMSGRQQLASTLPALRQQAAQMQALAKEATAAPDAGAQNTPAPPPMSRESIESSFSRKGLKPQNVSLTNDVARVQLQTASFSALMDALDDMQKTAAVSVVDANIVALAQPDQVNATVTLRQRKNE